MEQVGRAAVAVVVRQGPAVQDAVGKQLVGVQGQDQLVVARLAELRRQAIAAAALAVKGVSLLHPYDPVAVVLQRVGNPIADTGAVDEDEPGQRLRAPLGGCGGRLPGRFVEPVFELLLAVDPATRLPCCAGLDPVALPIEAVGGEHDATALMDMARRPVDSHPGGPELAETAEEMLAVRRRLLRVAQRRDARVPAAVVLRESCQRGQCGAWTDLEKRSVRRLEHLRDPGLEADGAAQMPHPVVGAGGLVCGDPVAGDVGDERQLRFAQFQCIEAGAELLEDRFQHVRVGRHVDVHPRAVEARRAEMVRQGVDRRSGARGDAERGCVLGRDRKLVPQACVLDRSLQGVRGQRHAEHRARRQTSEELAAQCDDRESVLQSEHAGDAGGRVLTHAVADHRRRSEAVRQEDLREGVLDAEQRGHGQVRRRESASEIAVVDRTEDELAKGEAVALLQVVEAPVECLPIHGLRLVQLPAHARVLRSAARKEEGHVDRFVGRRTFDRRVVREALAACANHQRPAQLEVPSPYLGGVGGVGELHGGAVLRPFGQLSEVLPCRCLAAAAGEQELPFAPFAGGVLEWPFFDDDVSVRAADAECADAGSARGLGARPRAQRVVDEEGTLAEVDQRIRGLKAERGRDLTVAKGLDHLDETSDARRRVEVTDVALDRSHGAELTALCRLAESLGEGRDLDRIADAGAGTVGLDVVDRIGGNLGESQSFLDHRSMRVDARSEVADLAGTVVVDGRGANHRADRIAGLDGLVEAAEQDGADAAAEDCAFRARVEGSAVAVRREDLVLFEQVALTVRQLDGDASGHRQVAFAGEQALARQVHRPPGRSSTPSGR